MKRETEKRHEGSNPNEFPFDPKLRAMTESILAQDIDTRLRQLEVEANFFLSVRPLSD